MSDTHTAPKDSTATATSTLRATSLAKSYKGKAAVSDVSLHVNTAEVVGLLGPNGAGKTTTFYMMVGLVAADSGSVTLQTGSEGGSSEADAGTLAADITNFPMHRRARMGIGYLPQESSVFKKLSVEDNLYAIAETLELKKSACTALVNTHLEDLGLTSLRKQKAYSLSGGERRRLEISRALITNPRFILLDEPFSGVDPISVADVQNIVRGLKTKGIGVLITDHNVRETLALVDRAYLMYEGKVLTHGTPETIVNDPESRKRYLGESFAM